VGLAYTTASSSGFITGIFVLFVPLFLFLFLGQPPTLWQWVATGLALVGLWLLTGGVGAFNRGDGLTVLSAAAYAGHLLVTDRSVRSEADCILLAFHQFWMTGLMALLCTASLGRSFEVATPQAAGVIAFLALVPTLSAFYVQMLCQRHVAPLKASLVFTLEPAFAAIFAWTLGGEPFLPERAAGGILILAAMMAGESQGLSLLKGRKKEVLPV
jgi:drug/metabolite transporter (DMT)-like permease